MIRKGFQCVQVLDTLNVFDNLNNIPENSFSQLWHAMAHLQNLKFSFNN